MPFDTTRQPSLSLHNFPADNPPPFLPARRAGSEQHVAEGTHTMKPVKLQSSAFATALRSLSLAAAALLLGTAPLVAQTYNNSIFGPNVYVLDPSIGTAGLNAQLNALNGEAQFSGNRHAILFKPGTYTLSAEVGYYEDIVGLGETPGAVVLNGGGVYSDQYVSGNLTQNFWRSVANYTVNPPTDPNSSPVTNTNRWGVSQGASFRRIHVGGFLELTDQSCAYASGGFISDSVIDQRLEGCSQQQWYTRNSAIGQWTGDVWNYVFSGVQGAPAQSFPNPHITTLASTPASREKPFLYLDGSGNYNVFVPALRVNSSGPSWSGTDPGPGSSLPISSFFIATPSNTVAQINTAIATPGINLILTPGVYQLASPIKVVNPNTVVLGMGFATLVPQGGSTSMTVADVDGVQIAGLIFDAGVTSSPVLLQVGNPGVARVSHQSNPTSLNDVFFRIGGATAGTAVTSLEVDSNNVILDNIWAWRADHGAGSTPIWTGNPAAHGVIVNGDNVTALGLAVEHYQQEQTLWNGNGGETIFYQSELPYDVPSQSAWKDGAANGYPSYVVANSVTTHQAFGIGVYSYFNQGLNIIDDNAILVPNTTGVVLHDLLTVFLSSQGFGQITHVIDNTGNISNRSNADVAQTVVTYGGVACTANCAPAAPTNLLATATSATAVNLSWTASTTTGVTYSIFRSTASGFTPSAATQIATGQTGTTFSDTGLTGNTAYYYVVQATNANGATASNQASVTTNTSAPNPPTNLAATAISTSQINLSWTASTTPGVYYEVFASTTAGFTPSEGTLLASTSNTTYANTGLKAATTYYYAVEAVGSTTSTPARASATTQGGLVTPPTNLTATAASSFSVNLSFTASTTSGVTYNVFESTTPGFVPSAANQVATGNPYTGIAISGLTAGTTYYFVVEAETSGGVSSAPSNQASATTQAAPPAAPTNVTAAAVSSSQINLNWTASTTPGVTYSVYRYPVGSGCNGSPTLLKAGITASSFSDTGLTPATAYCYAVQAVSSAGGVSGSIAATAVTPSSGTGGGAAVSIDSGSPTTVGAFVADTDFTGGSTYAPGATVTVPAGLANAAPAAVYATARQGNTFTYTIPGFVANSTGHTVTLHFAELYFGSAGARQFNVAVNGTPVASLQNFDIFAAAGGKDIAVTRQVTGVTANGQGQITVTFSAGSIDQPMVGGLTIQ